MMVNFVSQSDPDVILLTTTEDGVTEFHVHKRVLSEASSFFCAMFSLPEPPPQLESTTHPKTTGYLKTTPVVPMSEPAPILKQILRFVYKLPNQQVSLDELPQLLAVATKYDLVPALDALRAILVSSEFLNTDPLRVYSIACRFDLDQEADLASKWTLNISLPGDEDTDFEDVDHPSLAYLRHISAYDYYRLLVLRRRRARAVCALLQIPDNIKCMHCNGSVFTTHVPPKWWGEWIVGAKSELRKGTTTEKIFGVDNLFEAARRTGCVGCTESVLHSWSVLMDLKASIDQIPNTLQP